MENDKTIQSPIMSLLRQKALLQTEYDEEKENFKRQMQAMDSRDASAEATHGIP